MNNLDRMVAIAVRIAEREGLLYEDDLGSISTEAASSADICHSPAIPFSNNGGTIRDDEGEDL